MTSPVRRSQSRSPVKSPQDTGSQAKVPGESPRQFLDPQEVLADLTSSPEEKEEKGTEKENLPEGSNGGAACLVVRIPSSVGKTGKKSGGETATATATASPRRKKKQQQRHSGSADNAKPKAGRRKAKKTARKSNKQPTGSTLMQPPSTVVETIA